MDEIRLVVKLIYDHHFDKIRLRSTRQRQDIAICRMDVHISKVLPLGIGGACCDLLCEELHAL